MTDNEIIKAFDCCNNKTLDCDECPCHYKQEKPCLELDNLVFDLINRQQAEIERLTNKVEELSEVLSDTIRIRYAEAKAEAYKEFAENVSKLICDNTYPDFDKDGKAVNIWNAKDGYKQIDNLLKEMVGDNNE